MTGQMDTIVTGLGFIEGLRWHEDRCWYSDFGSRRVQSTGPDGDVRNEAWVPGQPSGLGFAPNGGLLVVSSHDARLMRFDGKEHLVLADIGAGYRGGLNDMLTLANGRCYVSSFPAPLVGQPSPDVPANGGSMPLFVVEPDGAFSIAAEDLKFPNGIVVTADGATLLVAETMANRISAFALHADGSLGERRTYCELGHRNPDGISIDRQDRLWVACPFTSEFVRVDTSGTIDETIEVPGRWAVTCAVGASDDELWCSAVETTIEDYKDGYAIGSILRWRR